VTFAPVSLERLIDSPLLAGEFYRVLPLASAWQAELDITGDSQAAVDNADDAHAVSLFGKLIDQDRTMFGFRHWATLHLLVSQSEARSSTAWSTKIRRTRQLATPGFPRRINWKGSDGSSLPMNNRTPGTASTGARRSCTRSPTTRAPSGRHCFGCMRG
jgi:hypothetical protein